jgi:hypothetical protein
MDKYTVLRPGWDNSNVAAVGLEVPEGKFRRYAVEFRVPPEDNPTDEQLIEMAKPMLDEKRKKAKQCS